MYAGIAGKVIAVTGASAGIGAATARLLAERGARLVLGARRREKLDALAAAIGGSGGDALAVAADVSRRDDLRRLVDAARERFGRLDVLVSNAGTGPISPLDALRVEEWERMVDINLKGVLYGVAAALPVFRAQGSGHFVHLASTAALRTVPNQAVYSATKAAVRAFTEGLRQEAGENLRVTLVTPGFVRTDFIDAIGDTVLRNRLAAKRDSMAIAPEAVARAIAFAVEQPPDVDVGEIVVRPTAQA
ncbi:MAG: SDR family oxidoreductase [Gluconacetobacter diazotrophicus]|nr:SDR family oxidoreductase [Gluconacetobacter diazotrophicus]